jgi:colanic acid/amylovoran biosynthesis glycosyltransferase
MEDKKLTHVHAHCCANSALIALFANSLTGISYSMTLHGGLEDYGRQQDVKWRHAAFAITITKRLYHQVHEQLGDNVPNSFAIAPMGVDPAVFRRRQPYVPWDSTGPLHLFSCGRLNYVKGHQDLIQAVAMLRGRGIDARLKIAGEDDRGGTGFRSTLEAQIARLHLRDSVTLLGAVSEARVLKGLEDAHLFVLASHHEPLGVAIMEAMSCEVPVIATNQGGVPELIDHGLDGYLIGPQDAASIANAVKGLATNKSLALRLSSAGREKILRHFNSDISAAKLKQLLQRMAQN